MMSRSDKVWVVLLVAALGAWGCSRGTEAHDGTQAERLRQVEAKCAKLEADYRALSGTCSQALERVAALTAENTRLAKALADHKKELACRTRELETVKKEAESRTGERDALQARCDRLKKGIQSLLGQDDAQLSAPAPVTPVSSAPAGPSLSPS